MKWTGGVILALLLVAGTIFSRCGRDSEVIDTVATPISQVVTSIRIAEDYYNQKVQLKTRIFYRANEYHRAWLKKRRPEKIYKAFVKQLREAPRYGLEPQDYHLTEIEKAVESLYDNRKRTSADISDLDIRISASFFLFTTHLIEGRVRYPGARAFLWEREMPLENDIALLLKMKSASDLKKVLEDLHPKDPQYKKLQGALEDYRELVKADTFAPIPEKLDLAPGESHEAIPVIRKKLSLTEHIRKKRRHDADTVYDDDLVQAVKRFQARHGLEAEGVLDAETIRWINARIKQKVDLILINLERLRWNPHVRGDKEEIIINVPEYVLRVYKNGKEKMNMRVILGAEYTPTPVFHDTLKYIVFNPTWMVPKSIFEKEFLPKLRNDPGHFSPKRFRFYKEGKEIDPYLESWSDEEFDPALYGVVENPGEANSLGDVKFIMPNDFSIYLHDTPADQLFDRDERALSHGCIRLEKPEDFAHYLLSDQKEWNEGKIREAMQSDKPLQVDLEKPYPVYIVYRTVWVDDERIVHFREDIYGHDGRQLAYLAGE